MINTFAFLDDFCLQQRHQFRRRFFPNRPVPGSGYNDPHFKSAYSTIQYVPEQNRYLMWANFNRVFCVIGQQSEHCLLALAESDDGLHYRAAAGSIDRFPPVANVVYAGFGSSIHGATVLYDPADPDPAQRFKCASSIDEPGSIMAYAPGIVAVSPDGSHWSNADSRYCWHRYWSDTYNGLIFNPVLGCYQIFFRASGTDRRICTTTSADLIHWNEPRLVLQPDAQDGPGVEFYGMPVFFHDGIFYGHLWIFETDDEDPIAYKMAGRVRTELAYSYDGLYWMRTRCPATETADYDGDGYGVFQNMLYNTILSCEGDFWLTAGTFSRLGHADGLSAATDANHLPQAVDYRDPASGVRRICRMKPGRYCGLESVGDSARLRTKNFFLSRTGPLPAINVACPYGEMRVQLSDSRNRPVPGFTFADSVPFRGDAIACRPLWKKRRIEEAAGKLFGLEIELFNGCIFGISGGMMPFHSALPQYSYGDVRPAAQEVWGTLDREPDYQSLEFQF